ncbi:MAG TPA: hypothetical protein VF157_02690 [Chloroflexota bacterium]
MRFAFVVIALIVLAMLAGPILSSLHWVVFGLVIWGTMSLLRGPRRYRYAPPPRTFRPRPSPGPLPPRMQKEQLPLDVQVKVEQIRRKVEVLLQRQNAFPFGSQNLYVVRATTEDYLPRTLDAFMAVPPAWRDRPMASGKTPLQELKEQLSLLDAKLDEIAQDLQERNFDRLLANRQFLEQRFGRAPVVL